MHPNRNSKGEALLMFFKNVGICESNESEVLAILEALRLVPRDSQHMLLVESDSSNVIAWISHYMMKPWKLQFYLNEIWESSSKINLCFVMRLHRPTLWQIPQPNRVILWVGVVM